MEKLEAESGLVRVKVEREFRNVAPQSDLEVVWELGEPGELDMDVRVTDWNESERVRDAIERMLPMYESGLNLKYVAEDLNMDKQRVVTYAQDEGYRVVRKKHPFGYSYSVKNGRKA
jgi:hypothetical protein